MSKSILLAGLVLLTAAAAQAQIISTGPGSTEETRGPESAILTVVNVGASPVSLSSFGTFGSIVDAGNLKWVIFEGAGDAGTLVYQSASIPATPGANAWLDAPLFDFTLLPNTTYQLGVIADQSFNYTWNFPGTEISDGGLTLPEAANGNAENFTSPAVNSGGGVQQSFRAFSGAAAPEPGAASLVLLGLLGAPLVRRRQSRIA